LSGVSSFPKRSSSTRLESVMLSIILEAKSIYAGIIARHMHKSCGSKINVTSQLTQLREASKTVTSTRTVTF